MHLCMCIHESPVTLPTYVVLPNCLIKNKLQNDLAGSCFYGMNIWVVYRMLYSTLKIKPTDHCGGNTQLQATSMKLPTH